MQLTSKYKLKKPEGTDIVNIDDFNENADIIETKLSENETNLNSHKTDFIDHTKFVVSTFASNVYLVTIDGFTAYANGQSISFVAPTNSTGSTSLKVNSLTAIPLKKSSGTAVNNLKAGGVYTVRYYNGNFILQGEGGEYGTATQDDVITGKTIGTENGVVSGTIPIKNTTNGDGTMGHRHLATEFSSVDTKVFLKPNPQDGSKVVYGGQVWVEHIDENFIPSNIAQGKTVLGLTGTFTNDATATASQILSGKTAYVKGAKVTGTITSKSAQTFTPKTTAQTIASGQYLSGTQTISGDANLVASNIISGKSIFGVAGGATIASLGGAVTAKGTVTVQPYETITIPLSFTPRFVLTETHGYSGYGTGFYNRSGNWFTYAYYNGSNSVLPEEKPKVNSFSMYNRTSSVHTVSWTAFA